MTSRWLKEFDARRMEADIDFALLLAEAHNREAGGPLKTRAEFELEYMQHEAAKRELCRRADAGDRKAVEQLVRERADLELLLDEAREAVRVEEDALRASVQERPSDPARPWRPRQIWDPPAPSRPTAHA